MHKQPKTCNGTDEPCEPCICGADKRKKLTASSGTSAAHQEVRHGPIVYNLQPKDK